MQPEQEALRLSAMVALCVGVYIITLSMDNFEKGQVPTRIGQVECTWWRAHFGGCEVHNKNHRNATQHEQIQDTGARSIKL